MRCPCPGAGAAGADCAIASMPVAAPMPVTRTITRAAKMRVHRTRGLLRQMTNPCILVQPQAPGARQVACNIRFGALSSRCGSLYVGPERPRDGISRGAIAGRASARASRELVEPAGGIRRGRRLVSGPLAPERQLHDHGPA